MWFGNRPRVPPPPPPGTPYPYKIPSPPRVKEVPGVIQQHSAFRSYYSSPAILPHANLEAAYAPILGSQQIKSYIQYFSPAPTAFYPESPPPPPMAGSASLYPPPPSTEDRYNSQSQKGKHCDVCEKIFASESLYLRHIEFEHIQCDFPGCNYSSPPERFAVHKLKHITTGSGESILDSQEEIERWIARRKACFPRVSAKECSNNANSSSDEESECGSTSSSSSSGSQKMSSLEVILRKNVLGGSRKSNLSISKSRYLGRSSIAPHISKYLQQFENKRASFIAPNLRKGMSKGGSSCDDFPICRTFLRQRSCPHGDNCVYSHDITKYNIWCHNRHNSGQAVKLQCLRSSALFYELIIDQIRDFEATLFAAFKVLVNNNFWQNTPTETIYPEIGDHDKSDLEDHMGERNLSDKCEEDDQDDDDEDDLLLLTTTTT